MEYINNFSISNLQLHRDLIYLLRTVQLQINSCFKVASLLRYVKFN